MAYHPADTKTISPSLKHLADVVERRSKCQYCGRRWEKNEHDVRTCTTCGAPKGN